MRILTPPQLFHAGVTAAARAVEFIADRIFLVVVLVIILGCREHTRWRDLHSDGLLEFSGFFQRCFARFSLSFLFV